MRANLSLCRGEKEEEEEEEVTTPRRGEEPEVQGKNAQSSAVAMAPFVFLSLLSLSLSSLGRLPLFPTLTDTERHNGDLTRRLSPRVDDVPLVTTAFRAGTFRPGMSFCMDDQVRNLGMNDQPTCLFPDSAVLSKA